MLSAACYFRGNFMTFERAKGLLEQLCQQPMLMPEFWNTYEPINNPFRCDNLDEAIWGAMVPAPKARGHFVRTLAFFLRKSKPRCLINIDLRLAPVQWGTAHNSITIDDTTEPWPEGAQVLAEYLPGAALPRSPDYARVVESSLEDPDRVSEFNQPMTGQELVQSMAKWATVAPMGPHGALENIYWFNYFGRVYLEFIGKSRLMEAGWARVEEIGDGLACYATERIDDPRLQDQRKEIADSLHEFVWTPGRNLGENRVPVFDYSEQLAALPADIRAKLGEIQNPR